CRLLALSSHLSANPRHRNSFPTRRSSDLAFEAVERATETGVDAVLIDTAGRLHTKTGLMDELGKVKRVVEKKAQVDEVLLVLDRSEEHTSELQSRENLVCRLLLEKTKTLQ